MDVRASARLRFRRPLSSDADAIFARWASDPEVTRFLAWPTHGSVEDTRGFIAWSDAEWARAGIGPLLIEESTSGRLIGSTGLRVDGPASAMVGYVLARDAWGHGFATEVLQAMTALADARGITHLYAHTHPAHLATQRVLEKGGYVLNACFVASRFPNLVGDGTARKYLRPPSLALDTARSREDIEACAHIMATSEPWITLQRTFTTLLPVVSDASKEVHLVRDAHGVAAFIILDMRGPMAGYVQTIAVREDRRGSGLGAAILSAVETLVYRRSPNVFLCVSSFNSRAQAFYARLSYERIGVWRQYVVPGSDEILLRKTIGPIRTFVRPA